MKDKNICWYVDNTNISHTDPKVVDTIIDMVEARFGTMTKIRKRKHTFVGMDI